MPHLFGRKIADTAGTDFTLFVQPAHCLYRFFNRNGRGPAGEPDRYRYNPCQAWSASRRSLCRSVPAQSGQTFARSPPVAALSGFFQCPAANLLGVSLSVGRSRIGSLSSAPHPFSDCPPSGSNARLLHRSRNCRSFQTDRLCFLKNFHSPFIIYYKGRKQAESKNSLRTALQIVRNRPLNDWRSAGETCKITDEKSGHGAFHQAVTDES